MPLPKGMPVAAAIHELSHHGSRPRSHAQIVAIAESNFHRRKKGGRTGLATGGGAGGVAQLPFSTAPNPALTGSPAGLAAAGMTHGDSGVMGTGMSPSGATNMGLNLASILGRFVPGLGMIGNVGDVGKGLYYGAQGLTDQPLNSSNSTAGPVSNYLQNPDFLQRAANWLGNQFGGPSTLPPSSGWDLNSQSQTTSPTVSYGGMTANPNSFPATGTPTLAPSGSSIGGAGFDAAGGAMGDMGQTGGGFGGSSGSMPFDVSGGWTGGESGGSTSGYQQFGKISAAADGGRVHLPGGGSTGIASAGQYDPFPFTDPAAAAVPNAATGYVPTPITASAPTSSGLAGAANNQGGQGGGSGSSGGLGGLASGLLGSSLSNLTSPIGSAIGSLLTPAASALGGLLGSGITAVGNGIGDVANAAGSALGDAWNWLTGLFADGGTVHGGTVNSSGSLSVGGAPPQGGGISHVLVAGGEFVVHRDKVAMLGRRARASGKSKKTTDLEAGHEQLRELVDRVRAHQKKFLSTAPKPKK